MKIVGMIQNRTQYQVDWRDFFFVAVMSFCTGFVASYGMFVLS